MRLPKYLQKYADKIYKMTWPKFEIYSWDDRERARMEECGKVVSESLAWELMGILVEKTARAEDALISAMMYQTWSRCEYEHWVNGHRYDEDAYFTQFSRWATSGGKAEVREGDDVPVLTEYLKGHPFTKLFALAKRRRMRQLERKKAKE